MEIELPTISFAKVARRLGVHPYSVFRWHQAGRGPKRVRLQALKVGGRWRTRWKWVKQFLAELNDAPVETSTAQQRREEAAVDARVKAWVKPWKRL
jgi:hypothetical protein